MGGGAKLAPAAEKLESILYFFGRQGTNQFYEAAYLLANEEVLLLGQDTGRNASCLNWFVTHRRFVPSSRGSLDLL